MSYDRSGWGFVHHGEGLDKLWPLTGKTPDLSTANGVCVSLSFTLLSYDLDSRIANV